MRLQLGLPSLRRGEVADLRFLDERTDPIDFCFTPDGPSDRSDHVLEARQRNCTRVDRLPAGRFLQQPGRIEIAIGRSEEHTSELQSLMRVSSAVFCLEKKTTTI